MIYKNKRIIARIDTKNNKVIKGICYEGYSVVGEIKNLLKKYYELGIHEIIMIDTIASLNNRNILKEFIFENTKNIFIPVTICGGLRNEKDIDSMLKAGADKIGINKVAIQNPEIIKRFSKRFGSQCITVSIEAKKIEKNKWLAYFDNGKEATELNVVDWSKKVEQFGAGEIFLTSIDQDGTMNGLDENLIDTVVNSVKIPVIASGGTKNKKDLDAIFTNTDVSGIAIASALHFNELNLKEICE